MNQLVNAKQLEKIVQQQLQLQTKNILPQITATITKLFEEKIKKIVETHIETSMRPIVTESFRAQFNSVVIPAFNKTAQEMLQQMAQTFEIGVSGYIKNQADGGAGLDSRNDVNSTAIAVRALVGVTERMTQSIVDTQTKILREFQER